MSPANSNQIDILLAKLAEHAPMGYAVGLHIRFAAPTYTAFSYPPKWLQYYTSQSYGLRDPLIAWGLERVGTIRWSHLTLPDPFGIMAQAAEHGLRFGIAVSCGPKTSRSIVGVARADREFSDTEITTIQAIVEELHAVSDIQAGLTPAQVDALRCIAGGDRHAAAAAKLGISESALKARLLSARQRLLARTTTEAIQRALEYRLI